jgi:hypothetical protein
MPEFTLEIETVGGIGDSDYLDRLAELVYEVAELTDPLLGLNADGSISASFSLFAETAPDAAQRGVALFAQAIMRARPMRRLAVGDQGEAAVGRLAVEPAGDRQAVSA